MSAAKGMGVAKIHLEARRLLALASANGELDPGGKAKATEDLTLLDRKIRTECPLLGKWVMRITGTSRSDLNSRVGGGLVLRRGQERVSGEAARGFGGGKVGRARDGGQTGEA